MRSGAISRASPPGLAPGSLSAPGSRRVLAVIAVVATLHPAVARARQGKPDPAAPQAAATVDARPQPGETRADQLDVRDVIRKLRHKEQTPEEQAAYRDWHRRMVTVAPFIGATPATGFVAGAAGNIAFFRGEPSTTHISSVTGSATFSTRGQVLLSGKVTAFSRDDRALLTADNRFQWTSQDTYGLGAGTGRADAINVRYDFVRVYETVYRRLGQSPLYAGAGFHVSVHANARAGDGADEGWDTSPYVAYSTEHGLPLETQTSAGASLNLLVDSRDNAINPARGWFAQASFRAFFRDFLGGDSTWQELWLDARTYYRPAGTRRHTLAFWFYGDLVTGGTAPYFDLPATGMDTFGRSGRGYAEGRFRGERLLYGEIEYRVTLAANGLIGGVIFANTTTVSNLQAGEKLFDSFAPGAGVGFRLLMDKRSRTNLCVDAGWGKAGSRGVYLAIQEAF